MLTKLLELLKQKESYSLEELADELSTSVQQIKSALAYLEELGYIKKVPFSSSECKGSCRQCHGCEIYGKNDLQAMWEIVKNE